MKTQLDETVAAIRKAFPGDAPELGIILGSGLGPWVQSLEAASSVPYAELPHFPHVSVAGHSGFLWAGTLYGIHIVALQGRVHGYEGHTAAQVAYPARVLCSLGIRALVLTNASGGINADFRAGDLMAIADHINLSGQNPLTGPNDTLLGPRFPDMTRVYDERLLKLLQGAAAKEAIPLRQGVYVHVSGPSYETPAEVRMLRILGADAVGMSTVPEAIVARHMGVPVAGISCITNAAAGLSAQPLSHEDVTQVASRSAASFGRLLGAFVKAFGGTRA